jgi:putative tryptophan/tyrosine transport system substrate-binding protein
MRRREFLAVGAGLVAAWPLVVRAQQPERMRRIGILLFSQQDRAVIGPMLEELQALGYIEGKTVAIQYVDAEGKLERIPELAAELARLNPDVIFSYGGDQALIVKKVITSVPVVVVVSNDPVETELVQSLARPGGNVTGVTQVNDQLAGKTIQLLKEVAPRVSRVAILWNPNHTDPEFRETRRAAGKLGVELQSLEVRTADELDAAFEAAIRERAEGLIVVGGRHMSLHRKRIGEFAAKRGLFLVGNPKWLLEVGSLLAFGPNIADLQRRAASHVSKVLRGAKPADLPMEQPMRFELVINMKVASALGLTIPTSVLVQADTLIE